MGKQTTVHLYHRILLSIEKEGTIDIFTNLLQSPKNYGKGKKPAIKGYVLHMCITYIFHIIYVICNFYMCYIIYIYIYLTYVAYIYDSVHVIFLKDKIIEK